MLFEGAIRNVAVRYFIDHDDDHRRATFVAGMGRSGTTWLAELLNYRNRFRFMYEPFDHRRSALAVNFKDHQYLRPGDADRRYLAPAKAIVTGLIREKSVDQHNRRIICDRRIVKEVRANLLLKWLNGHFPGMPIVLIVRHPFAVAASWMALGEDIDLQDEFLSQPSLVSDYVEPFQDAMRRCRTPFERVVAAWCIEVGVPLSQFSPGEINLVYYEDLCTAPMGALSNLAARISWSFDDGVLAAIKRPSYSTFLRDRLQRNWGQGPRRVVDSWRQLFSTGQVTRGRLILEDFGMDHVYGDDVMPVARSTPLPAGLSSGAHRARAVYLASYPSSK